MNARPYCFIGLDSGERLTLIAALSPALPLEQLEATWPLRAKILALEAIGASESELCTPAVSDMITRIKAEPGDCLLVNLGSTPLALACRIAAQTGVAGVVLPACRCALWSEGVTTSSEIHEYVQLVQPPEAIDLSRLRDCFVELMEQAAERVQVLALEQDDSLLDRFVDLCYHGEDQSRTVPIESLTDVPRLLKPFIAMHGEAPPDRPIEVTAIRMRCILSTLYPLPNKAIEAIPVGWLQHSLSQGQILLTTHR